MTTLSENNVQHIEILDCRTRLNSAISFLEHPKVGQKILFFLSASVLVRRFFLLLLSLSSQNRTAKM